MALWPHCVLGGEREDRGSLGCFMSVGLIALPWGRLPALSEAVHPSVRHGMGILHCRRGGQPASRQGKILLAPGTAPRVLSPDVISLLQGGPAAKGRAPGAPAAPVSHSVGPGAGACPGSARGEGMEAQQGCGFVLGSCQGRRREGGGEEGGMGGRPPVIPLLTATWPGTAWEGGRGQRRC